jgi:hypothetical protein
MCSVKAPSTPTPAPPEYVHNPYLDGGQYGNNVDANRIGTSALTIGLNPASATPNMGIGPNPGRAAATGMTPTAGGSVVANGSVIPTGLTAIRPYTSTMKF